MAKKGEMKANMIDKKLSEYWLILDKNESRKLVKNYTILFIILTCISIVIITVNLIYLFYFHIIDFYIIFLVAFIPIYFFTYNLYHLIIHTQNEINYYYIGIESDTTSTIQFDKKIGKKLLELLKEKRYDFEVTEKKTLTLKYILNIYLKKYNINIKFRTFFVLEDKLHRILVGPVRRDNKNIVQKIKCEIEEFVINWLNER